MGRRQKLIALLLLFAPFISNAQWSVGGTVGTASFFTEEGYTEGGGFGYQIDNYAVNLYADFQVEYRFAKRWSVQSGFRYSDRSVRGTPYCIYCSFDDPSSIFFTAGYTRLKIHYVEVPVNILFDFVQTEKVNLALSAGIIGGIPFAKDIPEFPESTGFNGVFAVRTGLDMSVNITERSALKFQVGYQHGILSGSNYNPPAITGGLGYIFRI